MNLFIIMGVSQLPFSLQKLFLEVLFHLNMRIIGINLISPKDLTNSLNILEKLLQPPNLKNSIMMIKIVLQWQLFF